MHIFCYAFDTTLVHPLAQFVQFPIWTQWNCFLLSCFSWQICSSWLLLLSSVLFVHMEFLVCNFNATKIAFRWIVLAKKEENWKESHTKYNQFKQYCTNVSLKFDTHTKVHIAIAFTRQPKQQKYHHNKNDTEQCRWNVAAGQENLYIL